MRYDQRVMVLVEVRGGQRDWDEAERAFGERGWQVASASVRGEGPSRGVLRADALARLYCVEVRFFGALNRRTGQAAAWQVERLARVTGLEMYARRCEPLDRDREQLTSWWVHTVDHRPPPVPVPRPLRLAARTRRVALLSRARFTERRGHHDNGVVVTGTASEARRISRMDLPEGSVHGPGTDVRPFSGRVRSHIVPRRDDDLHRRTNRFLAWLLAMAFCAVMSRQQSGVRTWVWAGTAVLCFLMGARLARVMFASGGRKGSLLLGTGAAGWILAAALGMDGGSSSGWTPVQMLVAVAVMVTVGGIWLLVRRWRWGEWIACVAPLAFALVVSLVVSSGSVLHAIYADSLDLQPEDLDVPAIWQAVSVAKLLSLLSFALFVPALWGIAKHVHAPFVSPVDRMAVPVFVIAQLAVLAWCMADVVESVDDAGKALRAAAARKAELPSYFGVQPEWTCVEPTVLAAKLSTRGGVLHPERPYVSFGEAGGTVSLWDEPAGKAVQMPAEQVRLVPVSDGETRCTFSYASLPKAD
ncbi:NnrS multi-domain protein [Streptomyces sp. NPDC006487]|uniref:NnrS multi-domain protein n=1 Tax=Streptomyces sp. NPDC006487 TaxID=3364748 RepID=UPI00367DAE34